MVTRMRWVRRPHHPQGLIDLIRQKYPEVYLQTLEECGRQTATGDRGEHTIHDMHNDRQILWIQQFIQRNLDGRLTTEKMAAELGMSVRNFDRRFGKAVGEAPSAYLQKLRVENAKRLLETTDDSIEEITVKVGYEDERSFRRLFRSLTGVSPKAYRLKYSICNAVHSIDVSALPRG